MSPSRRPEAIRTMTGRGRAPSRRSVSMIRSVKMQCQILAAKIRLGPRKNRCVHPCRPSMRRVPCCARGSRTRIFCRAADVFQSRRMVLWGQTYVIAPPFFQFQISRASGHCASAGLRAACNGFCGRAFQSGSSAHSAAAVAGDVFRVAAGGNSATQRQPCRCRCRECCCLAGVWLPAFCCGQLRAR